MQSELSDWTPVQRWKHALKPLSWPKLLVPALLGQALAVAATGRLDWLAVIVGLAFVLALGTFIVLLNDWGDQDVDRLKREMFPHDCSPKTIPDAILPARHLLLAGLAAGLAALVIAVLAATTSGQPLLFWLGLGCLLLFVGYSLPPLRLNYRGGGELLEASGVGVALPWWQFVLQAGIWKADELAWLVGFLALSLASALASGLADEESDRLGGKRTLASLYGNRAARRGTELAVLAGLLAWILVAAGYQSAVVWLLPALAVLALTAWRLHRLSPAAVTNAFRAQGRYKQVLHNGIWYGAIALAAGALIAAD